MSTTALGAQTGVDLGPWQWPWGECPALPSTDPPHQPTLTARLELDATGAEAGRHGLLLCRVDSDPPAHLQLFHGDRMVATTSVGGCSTCGVCSQRTKVTKEPNLLRVEIHNPVLEDEGEYLCRASNTLGNASASATFNAQGERQDWKGEGQMVWAGDTPLLPPGLPSGPWVGQGWSEQGPSPLRLCHLLSSHCPGHCPVQLPGGRHRGQSDLQCEPGSC